jgi:hypothetical protein
MLLSLAVTVVEVTSLLVMVAGCAIGLFLVVVTRGCKVPRNPFEDAHPREAL